MSFKNLEKNLKSNIFFKKYVKKSTVRKISIVWCFSSRADLFFKHLNVNFIKNYSQNVFFKKVDFCNFNPKNFEVKVNCSKSPLNVCPLKCTYIGKLISILLAFVQK